MKPQPEFYRDRRKEWRWRYRAANGKIIAESGEGYKNREDCEEGYFSFSVAVGKWAFKFGAVEAREEAREFERNKPFLQKLKDLFT